MARDVRDVRTLLGVTVRFERLVIAMFFLVLILGVSTAIVQGRPFLGPLQGHHVDWLFASFVLYILTIPLVPLVFVPRGLRGRAEACRDRRSVPDDLRAAFRDRAVLGAHVFELVGVFVVFARWSANPSDAPGPSPRIRGGAARAACSGRRSAGRPRCRGALPRGAPTLGDRGPTPAPQRGLPGGPRGRCHRPAAGARDPRRRVIRPGLGRVARPGTTARERAIREELRVKGIDRATIDAILEERRSGEDAEPDRDAARALERNMRSLARGGPAAASGAGLRASGTKRFDPTCAARSRRGSSTSTTRRPRQKPVDARHHPEPPRTPTHRTRSDLLAAVAHPPPGPWSCSALRAGLPILAVGLIPPGQCPASADSGAEKDQW